MEFGREQGGRGRNGGKIAFVRPSWVFGTALIQWLGKILRYEHEYGCDTPGDVGCWSGKYKGRRISLISYGNEIKVQPASS